MENKTQSQKLRDLKQQRTELKCQLLDISSNKSELTPKMINVFIGIGRQLDNINMRIEAEENICKGIWGNYKSGILCCLKKPKDINKRVSN